MYMVTVNQQAHSHRVQPTLRSPELIAKATAKSIKPIIALCMREMPQGHPIPARIQPVNGFRSAAVVVQCVFAPALAGSMAGDQLKPEQSATVKKHPFQGRTAARSQVIRVE